MICSTVARISAELQEIFVINLCYWSAIIIHTGVPYLLFTKAVCKSRLQGRKKELSSWEHNLETEISCRPTEHFCAKSACA
jgi:hypothetical protein